MGQIPLQDTDVGGLPLLVGRIELLFIPPLLHPLTGSVCWDRHKTAGGLPNSHSFKISQNRAVTERNIN